MSLKSRRDRAQPFRHALGLILAALATPLMAQTSSGPANPPVAGGAAIVEQEESAIATLPQFKPHWALLTVGWGMPATRVVDGDTGKILGTIMVSPLANVRVAPDGRFIYVAETIWTKLNRGTRQDLLTVYDARTLRVVREITLPGRLLTGNRVQNLDLSADGRFAYVYDMAPASSVIVVDLAASKVANVVEDAGCGLVFAAGPDRVASLCGDGTLSVAALARSKKPAVVQSAAFFAADDDPVFDNSVIDTKSGKAIFLSYSGLVYETVIGAAPAAVSPGWSLQAAAGMAPGSTKPLALSWLPGGRQLMAYNGATGRLYVLMHAGEFWSHKEDGTELWEVDVANRKVLRRHRLDTPARGIAVTQDASPLIFVGNEDGTRILDATTFAERHVLKGTGDAIVTVLPQ